MDKRKSSLKGEGIVMPGTANWPGSDDTINNDGMIGAGDPAYLIGSRFDKEVAPLDETKRAMYSAREKLNTVVNKLIREEVVTLVELNNLVDATAAVTKGINYLEHLDVILNTIKEVTDGWKKDSTEEE